MKKRLKKRISKRKTMSFAALVTLVNSFPNCAHAEQAVPLQPVLVSLTTNTKAQSGVTIQSNTAVLDVSNTPVTRINGNLTNHGTLYVVSTNPQVDVAKIIAQNIFNTHGATITTVLPTGGIQGFESAIPNLSLTLAAIRNIVNNGIISSAGNLNLVAGGTITNAPSASATQASAALQATNNINILASSIINHGVIASQLGNVALANAAAYTATVQQLGLSNISSMLSKTISINNNAGLISALNGQVCVGSSNLLAKSTLTMLGGTIDSPTINFDSGNGALKAFLNNATGTVNVAGLNAQFGTTSPTLTLGSLNITGDPTFFNTGNISIISDIIVPENLAIIAGGNITAASPVTIATTDANGQGHDVYIVAGAAFTLAGNPTPSSTLLTGGTPLTSAQRVNVIGASATGGTISLGNSVINTSSGAGDRNGGAITLVAYPQQVLSNPQTGGIENVNILTGGSGKGNNGAINVIAGGSIGATNIAIRQVQVTNTGGSGLKPGAINFNAALPQGKPSFNDHGIASATFSPSITPTQYDISIDRILTNDGGAINVVTGGKVTSSSKIDSSGIVSGRNGGDVTISGALVNISAPIYASGSAGIPGTNSAAGIAGGAGQDGGSGGRISITGNNGITIDADIISNGGAGGKGGRGGDGAKVNQAGAIGGAGGLGGGGGSISLETKDASITLNALATLSMNGGRGGDGGDGGLGAAVVPGGAGTAGGSGGAAGLSGDGGMFQSLSGNGTVSFSGTITAIGAAGAIGGAGKDGKGGTKGGAGGSSGSSSNGGDGGMVSISSNAGNINFGVLDFSGGAGGDSSAAGDGGDANGGTSSFGGDGGRLSSAGSGGDGGRMSIISKTGAVSFLNNVAAGGAIGGSMLGLSGKGGIGSGTGGFGGAVLDAGSGGSGGSLFVKTAGTVSTSGLLTFTGGQGGVISASAGAGGDGLTGRAGGSLGKAGSGGKGGDVSLTSSSNSITVVSTIDSSGGKAGDSAGTSGAGGAAKTGFAGGGGNIGMGGSGGKGGSISLSSAAVITVTGDLFAVGGYGTVQSGVAAAGGDSAGTQSGAGGDGGDIASTGDGGDGGRISLSAKGDVIITNINASGGHGGDMNGVAGNAGDGKVGGAGGSVGNSGSGGSNGAVSITTNNLLPPGLINVDNHYIQANGGDAGNYEAKGGNGGNGTAGVGGVGGSLGSQGKGGGGGNIYLSGYDFKLNPGGFILAQGGNTLGYELTKGSSGNGGNGGGTGSANGGNGGLVGSAGDGGSGGIIQLDIKNTIFIDNGGNQFFDSIGARGGGVGNFSPRSGKGGNAGSGNGNGGNGGNIGANGNGGAGGSITINGDQGDITGTTAFGTIATTGGYLFGNYALSGAGGNAGKKGIGGKSGSIANNGDAGKAGDIKISTGAGNINLTPLVAVGGDILFGYSPTTGDGGTGGSISGNGGNSGSIGNNGKGGKGGNITVSTKTGDIGTAGNVGASFLSPGGRISTLENSSPTTGRGGDAIDGNGGSSGSIGTNGAGGDGGSVTLKSDSGKITLTKAGTIATGGDGGTFLAHTGDGGNSTTARAGSSGNIDKNSGGGKGGQITITSKTGDVTNAGILVVQGGSAYGNHSVTGNGGISLQDTGGTSGNIGRGGDGGNGGDIILFSGGNINNQEALIAAGGNAASETYKPITGNGGNGAIKGGNSGFIDAAGSAGGGGTIKVVSTGSTALNLDRLLVDGGFSGFLTLFTPTKVNMEGQTGKGGNGAVGGDAGRVGDAATGGKAGEITLIVQTSIDKVSSLGASGGFGGDQKGIGGEGGTGTRTGGKGGAVGGGGGGGGGGLITVESADGPSIQIRDLVATGGAGGNNSGKGGRGGDATESTGAAGAGGKVDTAGDGGTGGEADISILNLIGPTSITAYADSKTGADAWNMSGGSGGKQTGIGGIGGNGMGGITGTKDSVGGAGGIVERSGGGGDGGTLKVSLPAGLLTIFDVTITGGDSGENSGKGGNGGYASGLKTGGKGGDVNGQGPAGAGGTFKFSGADIFIEPKETTPPTLTETFNLNGGNAGIYTAVSGKGGAGGGPGGDGGNINAGGFAGIGGTFEISASNSVTFQDSTISVNGGNRLSISVTAGDGGNGGRSKIAGAGGDGGGIKSNGGAGKAGSISISSLESDVTAKGSPVLLANGGDSSAGTFTSGNGGTGYLLGRGGNGGDIAAGPSAAGEGTVSISAKGNIQLPTINLIGGSIISTFVATSGNGGTGGTQEGNGGNGGPIASNGDAGKGGTLTLKTGDDKSKVSGDILITDINVNGGSVGDMLVISGNGGNAATKLGQTFTGGQGGVIQNNGNGGDGGSIGIITAGAVAASGNWTAIGGNVGNFNGTGGNGGSGTPAVVDSKDSVTQGGSGGGAGILGKNGLGGSGGSVKIEAKSLDISFTNELKAYGGNVGNYKGVSGNGGDGGAGGGDGGLLGSGGTAGFGGIVDISAENGDISTVSINVNAGLIGTYSATAGNAGYSPRTGGVGGSTGDAGSGAGGGKVVLSTQGGAVTITGSVTANGSAGADNSASNKASNGSDGLLKGGNGGSTGSSGDGGSGGRIEVTSKNSSVSITGDLFANSAAGGNQAGIAGKGGNASTKISKPDTGIAGSGGAVAISGAGGQNSLKGVLIGIELTSGTTLTVGGGIQSNGANGGANTGHAGDGGTALRVGGIGGNLGGTGAGSNAGAIKLTAPTISVTGNISGNGGSGGSQVGGVAGNGGNATGPDGIGGNGGKVISTGSGGNGATIVVTASVDPGLKAQSSFAAGLVGAQIPGTIGGLGGTGAKQNGLNGVIENFGKNGTNGSYTFNILTLNEWNTEDSNEHDLRKRKMRPSLIAIDSRKHSYSDYVQIPDETASELKEIGFVQLVTPPPVSTLQMVVSQRDGLNTLIETERLSPEAAQKLAAHGVSIAVGSGDESYVLKYGSIMFAPTHNIVVRTNAGKFSIAGGSKVIVTASDHETIVRNLHDRKIGDVCVFNGTRRIAIELGMQAILRDEIGNDNPSSSTVATRNTHVLNLRDGLTAHFSEFSMLSAMANDHTLRALSQSKSKEDRRHFDQIAKNACIIGSLTIKKGPYRAN